MLCSKDQHHLAAVWTHRHLPGLHGQTWEPHPASRPPPLPDSSVFWPRGTTGGAEHHHIRLQGSKVQAHQAPHSQRNLLKGQGAAGERMVTGSGSCCYWVVAWHSCSRWHVEAGVWCVCCFRLGQRTGPRVMCCSSCVTWTLCSAHAS